MSDIHIILKLNKEIEDFIECQEAVLESFETDKPYKIDKSIQTLFNTLRTNLNTLKNEKDIILGLKEVE